MYYTPFVKHTVVIVIRHCALIRSAYCDSVSQHAPVLYLRMYVSSNAFTYKWELIPSKSPFHNLLSLVDIVYQHDIQAKLESITYSLHCYGETYLPLFQSADAD